MSAISRPADLIRDSLRANVLTGYLPALMWNESQQPFTTKNSNIIYCKQTGRGREDFIREHDVEVNIFTKENAEYADIDLLHTDCLAAIEYITNTDFVLNNADTSKVGRVLSGVTGAYQTASNRYYFKFTVQVFS